MISWRQADLLDKVNEDKIKVLKQTFNRGSIVLDFVQGEIHTVGIDGTPEIKKEIFAAMADAGFNLNTRSDGKHDPYYTLIEDDQAPDAHNVIEGFIESLEEHGFDATFRFTSPRFVIEYKHYPLLKRADLLTHLPIMVGARVRLTEAAMIRISDLKKYYVGNVGTVIRIYEDMYDDMKLKCEVKWDNYVHTDDNISRFSLESFERVK